MPLDFTKRLQQPQPMQTVPSNAAGLAAARQTAPAVVNAPAAAAINPVVPARISAAPKAADIFAGIEQAKASFGANYLRDGRYFALLRNVKQDKNRKHVPFVAFELTILVCLPGQANIHRPGEECSHLLMANNDSFLGNLKGAFAGIYGCEAEAITRDVCREFAPETGDSPLAGRLIEVTARGIVTKDNKPFTVVDYRRSITATELAEMMNPEDEKVTNIALGVGVLEQMVLAEQANG